MQAATHAVSATPTPEQILAAAITVVKSKVRMCPPPCACAECETQFYSLFEQKFTCWHYAETLSDAQAKIVIANELDSTRAARAYLAASIEKHGDTILSRWRKRSTNKRAALLQQVEPTLPRKKWTVPRLSYAGTGLEEVREQHRQLFLLPYLDLETLSKDASILFGLLHNRTFFSPVEWVKHDHQELTMSWACGN
jgi:hypothetical protein